MQYTREQVTEALKAAVEEKGEDYVYPLAGSQCFYADPITGAPSCIVGHVIAKIDPEGFKSVVRFENQAESSASVSYILGGVYGAEVLIEFQQDHTLKDALRVAQSRQDAGATWGEAYAAYESWLARHGDNV